MNDKTGYMGKTGWASDKDTMVGVEVISVGEVIGGLISDGVGEG